MRLRTRPLLILLTVLPSLSLAHADLTHDLNAVLSHPALVQVGVLIETLDGQTLYSRHPDASLMPASNMKLATSALALRTWGDHHHFRTALYADEPMNGDGVVKGNLYLVGEGHPLLDDGFLTRLAQRLAKENLKRVAGSVVGAQRVTNDLAADRELTEARLLDKALKAQGVTVDASPTTGDVPDCASPWREWQSDSIEELALAMNKPSDNTIADGFMRSLLLAHEANDLGYDGLMEQAWRHLGLDLDGCQFVDGSGLSRRNRLTPRFLVGLLRYMRTKDPQAGAFVHTLPVAAVDGTLKKRMCGSCAAGTIRAKTGFLTGACCLSGYVDRCGQRLVFSMLMNGHTVDGDVIRAIQNKACVAMAAACGQ